MIRRARVLAAFASVLSVGLLAGCASEPAPQPTKTLVADQPAQTAKPSPAPPEFDKAQRSIDDATSTWVIVNKLRPLTPQEYEPTDLVLPDIASLNGQPVREEAARAAERLVAAAAADGVDVTIASAYRSFDMQVGLYGSFVANQGQAYADTTSARPGFSEHQTGLTIDFAGSVAQGDNCAVDTCFADTAAGQWLAARASEFGFTLRYPDGLESITGYEFEPWHYRYVGEDLSRELAAQPTPEARTLERFFGLADAGNYAG